MEWDLFYYFSYYLSFFEHRYMDTSFLLYIMNNQYNKNREFTEEINNKMSLSYVEKSRKIKKKTKIICIDIKIN